MNRVWAIKAEQRLTQLEQRAKSAPDVAALVAEIEALKDRVAALEAKPRVGRPPKDKE